MGFHTHRRNRIRMAGLMAPALRQTGTAPEGFFGRAGVYTIRSDRPSDKDALDQPDSAPASLRIRDCQVHDRSHLVVLPLLDAKVSKRETSSRSDYNPTSFGGHLSDCGCRKRGRRMAFIQLDKARLVDQPGKEDRDVHMRAVSDAGPVRLAN